MNENPNNHYWQNESRLAALALSDEITDDKEWAAFWNGLEGKSHMEIAQACGKRLTEIRTRKLNLTRAHLTARIVVGTDEKGNEIAYINHFDGTWLNTATETLFTDEFVCSHFSNLLKPVYGEGEELSELQGEEDGQVGRIGVCAAGDFVPGRLMADLIGSGVGVA